MSLYCPSCNTPIPAQNVNLRAMAALCPQCAHVFKFDAQPVETTRLKRKLKAPEEIKIYQFEDYMEVVFPCQTNVTPLGFAFGLLICLIAIAVAASPQKDQLGAILFGLIGLMIGVGITAWFYIESYNKISIMVTPEALTISYQPVPIYPPHMFLRDEIQQLYCKQMIANKGVTSFQLRALTHTDDLILLENLPENYALYLEQILEDFLGIQDMPVRGEY